MLRSSVGAVRRHTRPLPGTGSAAIRSTALATVSGGSSPGPRLRTKSANVSAVEYFGVKPSVSRIWSVATTRPCVSSRICSGEKSDIPSVRISEPAQVTAGSSSGTVG